MKRLISIGFGVFAVLLTVFALSACSDDEDEPVPTPPEEPTTEAEAVLTASKTEILANGKDEVVFTVTCGDEDVTDQSVIIYNGKKLASNVFTTKDEGEHVFYAVYNNSEVTKNVTVTASPDPNAEQFTDFRRRVLAIQCTGTWCGYCPRLSSGILYFNENDASKDDVVFVAAHNGDALANDASNMVINHVGVPGGFPTMKFNLDSGFEVSSKGSGDAIASNIRSNANFVLRTPAKTAIKATASQVDDNGDITINADIKVGVGSTYRVAAWLVEDKVYAYQNDPMGYGGADAIFNNHDNVLRASSSTNATGDLLNGKSKIAAETIETFSCKLNTKTAKVKDPANCRVLIVVTAYNSGAYTVDNVISVPLGATVGYEYKK